MCPLAAPTRQAWGPPLDVAADSGAISGRAQTRALTRVYRWDFAELAKPVRTPDGFLRAEGYITRSGVFEYRRADGTIQREYRPPEEVFASESLSSFALAPLTNEHPPDNLTPENIRQYHIGTIGHPTRVGGFAKSEVLIFDPEGIRAVESGKTQLSCGYACEIVEKPGVHRDSLGEERPYDVTQICIRGNHVALTARGRAGPTVGLRRDAEAERLDGWTQTFVDELPDAAFAIVLPGGQLDASGRTVPRSFRLYPHHGPGVTDPAEDGSVDLPSLREQLARISYTSLDADQRIAAEAHLRAHAATLLATPVEQARSDSVKITIDGREVDVPESVAAHIRRIDGEAAAAKTEAEKLSAAKAVLEQQRSAENSEAEKKKRRDAEAAELVERMALVARIGNKKPVEALVRMDSAELMREVITIEAPGVKTEGRSDEWLRAALEMLPQRRVDTAAQLGQAAGEAHRVDALALADTDNDPAELARAKMIKDSAELWRTARA